MGYTFEFKDDYKNIVTNFKYIDNANILSNVTEIIRENKLR